MHLAIESANIDIIIVMKKLWNNKKNFIGKRPVDLLT